MMLMQQQVSPSDVEAPRLRHDFYPVGFGAFRYSDSQTYFVYPATSQKMAVVEAGTEGTEHLLELDRDRQLMTGLFELPTGSRYFLKIGDKAIPDPASRYQPEGVLGPSEVVDARYNWSQWSSLTPGAKHVIYELHVGTFGKNFKGVEQKLSLLKELGVDYIQLMPLGECVGDRNWGYDITHSNAPFSAYGTPKDLRDLIDSAHRLGIGVIIDVVYNHLGPEANRLEALIPDLYTSIKTPWGNALNFENKAVREFFIGNALSWFTDFNVDGLRLDAAHAIYDPKSSIHFHAELSARVHAFKRNAFIVAEHPEDHPHLWESLATGGYGWQAKYHDHLGLALTCHFAGEKEGYYEPYVGLGTKGLARLLNELNQHSYLMTSNHDWVGNRPPFVPVEQRMGLQASWTSLAMLIFAPGSCMLFQGQEYGGERFCYFRKVFSEEMEANIREGRAQELKDFFENAEEVPDPFADSTFELSRHNEGKLFTEPGAATFTFLKSLINLKSKAALQSRSNRFDAQPYDDKVILLERSPYPGDAWNPMILLANVSQGSATVDLRDAHQTYDRYSWTKLLATGDYGKNPEEHIYFEDGKVVFNGPGALILEAREPALAENHMPPRQAGHIVAPT